MNPAAINHLALLCLLAASLAQPAYAARQPPDPVLSQFDQGYGVVAAQVLEAEQCPLDDHVYGVKFRVRAVVARPTRRATPLRLAPGDTLHLALTAGYAAMLERGPYDGPESVLAAGSCYYLTIRPVGSWGFEHAPGAEAATRVESFDARTLGRYQNLRALAALPPDHRAAAARPIVDDPSADDEFRTEVLRWIAERASPNRYPRWERRHTAAWLRQAWERARTRESNHIFACLDYALFTHVGAQFRDSPERESAWIDRLLASPPPGDLQTVMRDREGVSQNVRHIGRERPHAVMAKLLPPLRDQRLPLQLRWKIASVAHAICDQETRADPSWEAPLRDFYASALQSSSPWETRLIAFSLELAVARPDDNFFRRALAADPRLRQALEQARTRMENLLKTNPDDLDAAIAIGSIKKTLEWLQRAPR
jgi:hypothetical protein